MITTSLHTFINNQALEEYLSLNIQDSDKLLIQIFFNTTDKAYIVNIQNILNHRLPKSHIIGTSTDGSINNLQKNTNTTTISFTLFEKSELVHNLFSLEKNHEIECAKNICNTLVSEDSKVMILFTEGIFFNIEELIKEIHRKFPDLIIAGGLAGDNAKFKNTIVCDNHRISSSGVVGVCINSKTLKVYNDYNLSWEPIGKRMEVTKCEKNILHELDGLNVIETYKKFLGSHFLKKYEKEFLPTIGIEFPFIINRDGFSIARAAMQRINNSVTFAGEFQEGDQVNFSFTSVEKIIQSGIELHDRMKKIPIQTLFVYSCMARRRFMQENIIYDIEPLSQIAPVCGFYTYGEIYTTPNKKEFLNHTMTVLALSEEDEIYTYNRINNIAKANDNLQTLNALSNLIKISTENRNTQTNKTLVNLSYECIYNSNASELQKNSQTIKLTKQEKQLLDLLLSYQNKIVSFKTMENELWPERSVSVTTRRTLIHRLRKKVGTNIIETKKDQGCILNISIL